MFSSPRLGHPADQVLNVLKNKIDLKGFQSSKPYKVCHKAKQTRDPFPLSEHKTSSLADIVHLDVWGPYKVTRDGFRDVKFYETVYPFKNDSLTKEYIIEQSGVNNLNFFDNQWPSEPYDDERDPNDGGGTNSSSVELVVEAASANSNSIADPSASNSDSSTKSSNFEQKGTESLGSIIAEGGAHDDGATLNDDEFISEGKGLDLYNVDMLFQENANQDKTKDGQSVRRSSRKYVLPSKLNEFVVDGKVKYGIKSAVNYSNLSCDNFSFITYLNKTSEPKTYKEDVFDSKWVEAMNS
nr:hypothetical protein [Tanacetum cinerariifolium]